MAKPTWFIRELFDHRYLLLQLTLRDFKSRYAGSILGLFWAFLQPLAMMAILWFVFSYGLKANAVETGVKFIPWFFSASVAWNFLQDGIFVTSNAINDYAFLVKKIDFRVRLLPVVKILSALILHGIFLVLLMVILVISGLRPDVQWLSVFYYMFCSCVFLLGCGWLLAPLNVFTRDIAQLVGVLMQFGFWLTPIIWNWRMLPEKYRPLIKLNPLFYITEGYRDAFVYHRSIAAHGLNSMLYFWCFTLGLLALGHTVFKRLRPHFGDVL